MSRLSIYLLRDPETNEPKFVGITKRMSIIKKQHPCMWGYQRNKPRMLWLKSLVHKGLRPKIQLLMRVDPADAEWRRQMFIKSISSIGWELLNHRDEEAQKKRSERMRKLWEDFKYRKNNKSGQDKRQTKFSEIYKAKLKDVPSLESSSSKEQ